MDVIFDLDAGRAWFVGAMSRARTFAGSTRELLGVRFAPGGVPELREPASTYVDLHADLENALADFEPLRVLAERLVAAPRARRTSLLWTALEERVPQGAGADAVVATDRRIRESAGQATVRSLARGAGLSVRTLERRYAQQVGLTPKEALRVERVNTARALVESARGESLGAVAFATGYADQAHLTREFTDLLGCPPGAWREGVRPPVEFVQDAATAETYDEDVR